MRQLDLDDLRDQYDLVIIGGGPAGMAAAVAASRATVSVLLVDEAPELGGQIYRGIGSMPASRKEKLGKDYTHGESLLSACDAASFEHLPATTVWAIEDGTRVALGNLADNRVIVAKRIILATGAMERPFPVSGWTEFGVLGVGGAQSLLKASGIVPGSDTVLAGSGPLLWLYASQMRMPWSVAARKSRGRRSARWPAAFRSRVRTSSRHSSAAAWDLARGGCAARP